MASWAITIRPKSSDQLPISARDWGLNLGEGVEVRFYSDTHKSASAAVKAYLNLCVSLLRPYGGLKIATVINGRPWTGKLSNLLDMAVSAAFDMSRRSEGL